nr:prostaglandin E2 receptor EP3 subtype-like isoform X2 [Styela clava]
MLVTTSEIPVSTAMQFATSTVNISNNVASITMKLEDRSNVFLCQFDSQVNLSIPIISLTLGLIGHIVGIVSVLYRKFRPLPLMVYASVRKLNINESTVNHIETSLGDESSNNRKVEFHGKKTPAKKFGAFHVFACALFVVDIFGILMSSPVEIYLYFYEESVEASTRNQICSLVKFTTVFIPIATLCFIMLCAIERAICLKYPFWYHAKVEKLIDKVFYFSIILVLFFAALSSIPASGVVGVPTIYPCLLCLQVQTKDEIFSYVIAIIGIIMMLIMTVCNVYSFIVLSVKLKKNSRMITNYINWKTTEIQKMIQKIIITCITVACWLPFMIQLLIYQDEAKLNRQNKIAMQLAAINLILNPWIFWLLRTSNLIRFVNFVEFRCFHLKPNHDDD